MNHHLSVGNFEWTILIATDIHSFSMCSSPRRNMIHRLQASLYLCSQGLSWKVKFGAIVDVNLT